MHPFLNPLSLIWMAKSYLTEVDRIFKLDKKSMDIYRDKALKKIPVVILTTSNSDRDVIESFELGAAGYMVKSVDYEKFVETIRAIDQYWTLSKLPLNGE